MAGRAEKKRKAQRRAEVLRADTHTAQQMAKLYGKRRYTLRDKRPSVIDGKVTPEGRVYAPKTEGSRAERRGGGAYTRDWDKVIAALAQRVAGRR